MNKTRLSQTRAPTIPIAEPDGLIALKDLTKDVLVQFPIWNGARPLDRYQLALNSLAIGSPVTLPDPVPEGLLELSIPAHLLDAEGIYQVTFRVIGFPGGVADDSLPTTIRIDRTAPGAALLAPMLFKQINFGDALSGLVPGYAHMAIGDRIQTLCNGVQGPVYEVGSQDLDERPMQVSFDREFLCALDSPAITFTYQVNDRAGNQSRLASPVTLSMHRAAGESL